MRHHHVSHHLSVLTRMLSCVCILVAAVMGGEAAVRCTPEQVAACVTRAPQPAVDLDLDLRLRLVDYVDFTDPADPHDRIDRGTSRIVDGPAGRYRETAAHRHAQFAVRWRAEKRDAPHVLVFAYPDDARREIAFFTHESPLTGKKNLDWSLETGVYCGDPLPLTRTMQYHTMFFWPTDQWPVAMVMNWARSGAPAAASRMWVYAVDGGLPPLAVSGQTADQPRLFGTLYNWSLVPTRGIFGLTDPDTALDHIVEYHRYRGDNVLSWPVVSNNSWGFRCQIPAWDGGANPKAPGVELDRMLKVCEAAGMRFLPVINTGNDFTIGGKPLGADNREAFAAGFRTGLEQFLARYGSSPAVAGLAFDTQDLSRPYGEASLDTLRAVFGSLEAFTAFMRERAPRLKLLTFLGGRNIHDQYFHDAGDVVARWEKGSSTWGDHLAVEADRLWKGWNRDPAQLGAVPGLGIIAAYQHDDHAIFDEYHQNPRAMFYYDMEESPAKARLVDTRSALVWNTFFEGYIGLTPANWWYMKTWVAPDFCPAQPSALAGWSRAMQHRDRDLLLAGAWGRKGGGVEASLRRFARAYRSLPSGEMAAVAMSGSSPVVVRSLAVGGSTSVSLLNPTPFPATVELTIAGAKRPVTMPPFALEAVSSPGVGAVTAAGEVDASYAAWVDQRLAAFAALCTEVRALEAAAVPSAFDAHLVRARDLVAQRRHAEADVALGHGLTTELELRRRILAPPRLVVPRLASAPAPGVDLDAWPAAAADIRTTDADVGTHLFFTTQWEGAKDLSARIRMGHDGSRLYLAVAVSDDVLCAKDGIALSLSSANYRRWLPQALPYEQTLAMTVPLAQPTASGTGEAGATWTTRRTADGYIAEAVFDLAQLGLKPGSRIGWILRVGDDDNTTFLNNGSWARKNVLLVPNVPAFAYWEDARSCGELLVE